MPVTTKLIFRLLSIAMSGSMIYSQSMPARIEIVVTQGDDAVNNIRRRSAAPPAVRVQQPDGQAVAGAAVVFTLPTEGATGDFDGEKTIIVTTDADGRAAVKSLKLNGVPGKIPIHVTASFRGLTARAVINQMSVVPPGEKAGKARQGGHGALIAVLVAVGAAAGGGAAYALSQQSKQTSAGPGPSTPVAVAIGITPGTGSIAGAH